MDGDPRPQVRIIGIIRVGERVITEGIRAQCGRTRENTGDGGSRDGCPSAAAIRGPRENIGGAGIIARDPDAVGIRDGITRREGRVGRK